jgi:uncharacterized membrane protein
MGVEDLILSKKEANSSNMAFKTNITEQMAKSHNKNEKKMLLIVFFFSIIFDSHYFNCYFFLHSIFLIDIF